MRKVKTLTAVRTMAIILVIGAMSQRASAFAHLWEINEIYSNADGSIQFIEMINNTISTIEGSLSGTTFTTTTNTNTFTYDKNLVGDTDFKKFLMATAGFAALSGTPTPDYEIPDQFFAPNGDTLKFVASGDTVTFVSGQLPLCGTLSMNDDFTTGTNSPTNFADETGPITIVFAPLGDLNGDCIVDLLDFALMVSNWTIDCLSNPALPACAS